MNRRGGGDQPLRFRTAHGTVCAWIGGEGLYEFELVAAINTPVIVGWQLKSPGKGSERASVTRLPRMLTTLPS